MVKRHQGLKLTQEQRLRWITRMAATADLVGLPDDPDFRAAFVGYLEWGTRIAVSTANPALPSSTTHLCPSGAGAKPHPSSPSRGRTPKQPTAAAPGTPPAPTPHPADLTETYPRQPSNTYLAHRRHDDTEHGRSGYGGWLNGVMT